MSEQTDVVIQAESIPATETSIEQVEVEQAEVAAEEKPLNELQQAKNAASVIDKYFEEDSKLREEYHTEKPLRHLDELPLVEALSPSIEVLAKAVELCKKLTYNRTRNTVRTNVEMERTTLILRDLPTGITTDDIKKLLESEELQSKLTGKVGDPAPEVNQCYYITFSSEEDCVNACEWIIFHGKLENYPHHRLKARVKSVLPTTTTPYSQPSQQDTYQNDYYTYQNFQYYQNQYNNYNYNQPWYPPGALNQNQTQQQPMQQNQNQLPQNTPGNVKRNRSNRRNNRGRGNNRGGRSQNNRGRGNRRNNSYRKQNKDAGGMIDYEAAFKLHDRLNMEAIINQYSIREPNPPMPQELVGHPELIRPTSTDALLRTPVNTAMVSPMPSAKSGPAQGSSEMPEFSLDSKKKERKGKKNNKRKKHKSKKTAKPSATVVNEATDDQKETEDLSPPVVKEETPSTVETTTTTAAAETEI